MCLTDQEIELLLKRTDEVPLEPYDIISDPKTVVALSLLYNSMVSQCVILHSIGLPLTYLVSNGLQAILRSYVG